MTGGTRLLLPGCIRAIAKHPVRAQRNTGEERRTDTPVESGRSSRANHATRQSTQLDDSSGREHSFATATISSFRMTRYYKTPACATWLLHGGPKAVIHLRVLSPESNALGSFSSRYPRRNGRNSQCRRARCKISPSFLRRRSFVRIFIFFFFLYRCQSYRYLFPLSLLIR